MRRISVSRYRKFRSSASQHHMFVLCSCVGTSKVDVLYSEAAMGISIVHAVQVVDVDKDAPRIDKGIAGTQGVAQGDREFSSR